MRQRIARTLPVGPRATRIPQYPRFCLAAAGLGLTVLVLGAVMAWQTLLQAWLVAWMVLALPSLGAMALLMVHGLTGGAWGRASEPIWRGMAAVMPLLALALLPLLLGLDVLFPWTAPVDTLPDVVRHKLAYLNQPFFITRTLVYLAVWILLARWLTRPGAERIGSRWYAPGLIVWVLSITFFCYDWLMSLEPSFYSDIYGLEIMAFAVTSSLALGLLFAAPALTAAIRLDLANLWLAVLLAWAFLAFSQLIIIWSANLPHEIAWYLTRGEGTWRWVGRISVLGYLVVPFAMLLPTSAKRHARWLQVAATSCAIGHVLHVHWLVWPTLATSAWAYLLGPAAMVMLALACLLWLGPDKRRMLLASHPVQEGSHGET